MRQQQRKLMRLPPEMDRQTAADVPTIPRSHHNPGVLVVDDEHMVRILVQLWLERSGFEVWLASNGHEAIDLFQTHRHDIDVVLLDVRMPGLDGPRTLDALRKLDPEIQACFMSGDLGAYDPAELIQRGTAHVIAKPFVFDQLVNILRQLVQDATDLPVQAGIREVNNVKSVT